MKCFLSHRILSNGEASMVHISNKTRTIAECDSYPHQCPWQYKLKRCSNKECCKQCRYVMFNGTMTKWPVRKLTQGTTQKLLQHHDATDIKTNYIFVFLDFYFFYFLFIDNSPRNVELPPWYGQWTVPQLSIMIIYNSTCSILIQ